MEEILLDDLYQLRERLLSQMMQALAAQYGMGCLQGLGRRATKRIRSDVMGHLREFDQYVEETPGDLKPQSPYQALMIQWLAINADIEELEGVETASSDYIGRR